MTVSIPESVPAEGNVKVVFVPALADPAAATTTEITAGIDISCYLMPEWDGPSATQNSGERRRFCSKESFTRLGRVAWSIAPLVYSYDPQGEDEDEGNLARVALAEGNEGYVLMFYGIAPEDEVATADKYDAFPAECGVQDKDARGADEFSDLTITQTLGVTGPRVEDGVVAA